MGMSFEIKPGDTQFYMADYSGRGWFRFYRSIAKAKQLRDSRRKYFTKRGYSFTDMYDGANSPIYEVTLTWRELSQEEIDAER